MIARRIAKATEERAAADGVESQTVSSFLRGLTAGALIGAAIAGSALLQRRRTARRSSDTVDLPAEPSDPDLTR
jgi:formate/nitrite transporter FocA (FNT family)